MIRLTYVLRRLPHLSRNDFQSYWRNTHGPLVAKNAAAIRVRRYVQVHTIEDPLNELLRASRGAMEAFDGVAELWWDDLETLTEVFAAPEGQRVAGLLHEDEQKFIDMSRSSLWLARDNVIIEGAAGRIVASPENDVVQLFFAAPMQANRTLHEAQRYWLERHGPLARRHAKALGILRYVQVHRIDDPANEMLRASRGSLEPMGGHAELWFDRRNMEQAVETAEGQKGMMDLLEDEGRFVDLPRSALGLAKEHVIIEG
ncbi:MAG: EthD domain-containing protein [bacterium]